MFCTDTPTEKQLQQQFFRVVVASVQPAFILRRQEANQTIITREACFEIGFTVTAAFGHSLWVCERTCNMTFTS